jgi:hypothetical protein
MHITSLHPTTLGAWKALESSPTSWFESPDGWDYLEIVVIARELRIDWILPAAFYRVCDFTRDTDILSGPLELGDKLRCITGCRVLETAGVAKILEFLWSPFEIPGCDSTSICFRNRVRCRRNAEAWRENTSDESNLLPLQTWEDSDWDRLNVCDVCLASMKIAHQEAKESFWDSLPKTFDLPDWNELEKLKTEALK